MSETFKLGAQADMLSALTAIAGSGGRLVLELWRETPSDPITQHAVEVDPAAAQGYPSSIGSFALRKAAARWIERQFGVAIDPASEIAACLNPTEFASTLPQYLQLRIPDRDTVLYPAVSSRDYFTGAVLSGCRPLPYRSLLDVGAADIRRSLVAWTDSPSNPDGKLRNLAPIAEWGRHEGVLVVSDERHAEMAWAPRAPRSILQSGTHGVIAVHSMGLRPCLGGNDTGFFSGDPDVVGYLREVRKHAGMSVPGPIQSAMVPALNADDAMGEQRQRYDDRLSSLITPLRAAGYTVDKPHGGMHLWVPVRDAVVAAHELAQRLGAVALPGNILGDSTNSHLRISATASETEIAILAMRLARTRMSH